LNRLSFSGHSDFRGIDPIHNRIDCHRESKRLNNVFFRIEVALLFALVLVGVLSSVLNSRSPQVALAQTNGPSDSMELEDFLDNEITGELNVYHIPGASVSVVKSGQLFFAKGYGYASLQDSKPVVANQTLFMVGSVTKLFTWTAVMQLVEQGKLDLNVDVNTYLTSFQIPATYLQPITLKNLMAHNAGFEDRNIGTVALSAAEIEPLGEYLAHNMPARVRPPGEVTAYSNYGVALAGYIVEQVSETSFDDYIEANILTPLDMHHTTTRQPVPSDLATDMSMCYSYAADSYQAGYAFLYLRFPPAGSMRSTVADMANFMTAHLQDGVTEASVSCRVPQRNKCTVGSSLMIPKSTLTPMASGNGI